MPLQSRSRCYLVSSMCCMCCPTKRAAKLFGPYSVLDGFLEIQGSMWKLCGLPFSFHPMCIPCRVWTPIAFVKYHGSCYKYVSTSRRKLPCIQHVLHVLTNKKSCYNCLDHIQRWMGFGDPGFHVEVVELPSLTIRRVIPYAVNSYSIWKVLVLLLQVCHCKVGMKLPMNHA